MIDNLIINIKYQNLIKLNVLDLVLHLMEIIGNLHLCNLLQGMVDNLKLLVELIKLINLKYYVFKICKNILLDFMADMDLLLILLDLML